MLKKLWPLLIVGLFFGCSNRVVPGEPAENNLDTQASSFTSTLIAKHSSLCMSVRNGSTSNYAPIEQVVCATALAPNFTFDPVVGKTNVYTLTNVNSSRCVWVDVQTYSYGTAFSSLSCQGRLDQQFELVAAPEVSGGYYQLKVQDSGKCATVSGASTASGTRVVEETCQSASVRGQQGNQLWKIVVPGATSTSPYLVACLNSLCTDSESINLDGATIAQTTFGIRWKGAASSVTFTVDGSSTTENIGPFDAYGTGSGSNLKSHTLGQHTAKALVNGGTTYTASFTVTQKCDFYAATTGSNSNAGTLNSPFGTLKYAVSRLQPGNTLCIRGGIYPALEIKNLSGTVTQPITLINYGNERPVLDRNVDLNKVTGKYAGFYCEIGSPQADCAILTLNGSNYITIDGLELTDSSEEIKGENVYNLHLDTNSDNLDLVKARVEHKGIRAVGATPVGIVIRNTEIHHVWRTGIAGLFQNSVFENNDIHHAGSYGTYIRGSNIKINNNSVHHTAGLGLRVGNQYPNNGFDNGTISRNRIYDIGLGTWYFETNNIVKTGGPGIHFYHGNNSKIYYNLVRDSSQSGLVMYACSTEVLHNTVTKNGEKGIEFRGGGSDCAANRSAYNIYYANGSLGDASANDLVTDPQFVKPDSNDYHLRFGSPAIDKGVIPTDTAFSFDIEGKPIVGRADAGAYEY